jgi:hypothetical protein
MCDIYRSPTKSGKVALAQTVTKQRARAARASVVDRTRLNAAVPVESNKTAHFIIFLIMPKSWSVCPDCGRTFKSTNGLSLHRNYCVKRPPKAPYKDYFHGDHINDLDAPDWGHGGKTPKQKNSANTTVTDS